MDRKLIYIVLTAFIASVLLSACSRKHTCPAYGNNWSKITLSPKDQKKRIHDKSGRLF